MMIKKKIAGIVVTIVVAVATEMLMKWAAEKVISKK